MNKVYPLEIFSTIIWYEHRKMLAAMAVHGSDPTPFQNNIIQAAVTSGVLAGEYCQRYFESENDLN